MKPYLKSRRGPRGVPRVSLFPFLAVLICTMGALVIVLFVVMRQARLHAVQEATAKAARIQSEKRAGEKDARQRIEKLEKSQEARESRVAQSRSELEQLQTRVRELRERRDKLQAATDDPEKTPSEAVRRQSEARAEFQRIKTDIAETQRRLADAHQAAERKPRSFAIIPYRGPNQTYRRPIYLECRENAVILQPEGILFTGNDFAGSLDRDNPLAAAMAAANTYLRGRKGFDLNRDGEPYPLLLVRPGGIMYYYAAREALSASYTEFGYELIGEDWPLHFPPPDIALAEAIAGELGLARLRHKKEQQLASLSSRSERPKSVYRVSASGEMVREGRAADDGQGGWEGGQQTAGSQQAASGPGYPSAVGGAAGTGLPGVASGPGVAGGTGGGGTGGLSQFRAPCEAWSNENGTVPFRTAGGAGTTGGGTGVGGVGVGGMAGGGGPGGPGSGMGGGAGGGTGVGGVGTGGPGFGGIGGGTGSGMAGGAGGSPGVGGTGVGGTGFGGIGGGTGSGMAGGGGDSMGVGGRGFGGVGGGTGIGGGGTGGTGFGGIGGGTGSGMAGGGGDSPGVGGMGTGGTGFGGIGGGTGSGMAGGGSGTADMGLGGLSGMSGVQNGSAPAGGFNAAGGSGGGTLSGSGGGTSGYTQGMSGTVSSPTAANQGSTVATAATSPDANNSGSSATTNPSRVRPDGYVIGGPAGDASNARTPSPANAQPSLPPRPGEWIPAEPYRSASEDKPDDKKDDAKKKSLAKDRGKDWALHENSRSAIALTRPIHVQCWSDRILFLSDRAETIKAIPLEGGTEKSVDRFIAAVWEQMNNWGIAGRGMYWRPNLEVYVAPGGEERFAELNVLLAGSGLTVVRM